MLLMEKSSLLLILIGALLFVSTLYIGSATMDSSCQNCNVILISIDTLAPLHTSPYNPELDTMPFLKQIAQERGVVFEHAYAQAPWTLPSHTAMLTGKYPWDLGVWEFLDAVPLSADTLAEKLKHAGYRTALFSNGSFVQKEWQFDQGFDEIHGSMAVRDWNDLPALFLEAGVWIASDTSTTPYFAFIRPFEAHDPYRDGTHIGEIVAFNEGITDDKTTEEFQSAYRADLLLIDNALKDFVEKLETNGQMRDTLIIVTSDHGEEFGEHGTTGLHGTTVYEESIHVPLIVFVPGVQAKRVASSVETRSIPATVLDLVGLPYTRTDIAPSLRAHLLGETNIDFTVQSRTRISREELLRTIETAYKNVDQVIDGRIVPHERTVPYSGTYTEGVVHGTWKALRPIAGEVQLYNLATDPKETRDLRGTNNIDMVRVNYLLSFLNL